jgi:short-subunit dehydrogenase
MDKKICVITGANSGIGKAAAVQIAREGYFVIMTARSKERGEKALQEVRTLSKSNSVELMNVDLSLKSSIKHFAEA